MSKLSKKRACDLLDQPGRFLYVTHGTESVYAINGAGVVPRRVVDELTADLFGKDNMPIQRRGERPLVPQEDGLFPGFSQTWRAAR